MKFYSADLNWDVFFSYLNKGKGALMNGKGLNPFEGIFWSEISCSVNFASLDRLVLNSEPWIKTLLNISLLQYYR